MTGLGYRSDLGYCVPVGKRRCRFCGQKFSADAAREYYKHMERHIMLQEFEAINNSDDEGNPTGGAVTGVGFRINWQNGPLGRGEDRRTPNGAFVETVIAAAKQRIEYYQESKFNCEENAEAIEFLGQALYWLNKRTERREEAGVEGTHEVVLDSMEG